MGAASSNPWPFPERPKPPCSLTDLIALAIQNMPGKTASVNQVTDFIARWFPYYQQDKKWHSTAKRVLYGGNPFIKLPRKFDQSVSEYALSSDFENSFNARRSKLRLSLTHHVSVNFPW
jgi:hypothetical protein